MLTLLLLGCGPPDDPALTAIAASLKEYDAGVAKMEANDPKGAIDAFTRARAHQPDALPLALWQARAQADAGDPEAAVYTLDAVLTAHPGASEAWYNRAAYKARIGDSRGAAQDLQVALRAGVSSPHAAAADPDFRRLRDTPGWAGLLPPAPVTMSVAGPEGSVFLGTNVELTFTLIGVPSPAPTLTLASGELGCLAPVGLVEDDHAVTVPGGGTELMRVLTLRLRPMGGCTVDVGPFTLTTDGLADVADAVRVQVDAPPGTPLAAPSPPLPLALPLPSTAPPGPDGPAVLRTATGVVAMSGPERPVSARERPPDLTLEWRVEGQTRAVGGWWRPTPPVTLSADGWAGEDAGGPPGLTP